MANILIIEDENTIAELEKDYLELSGFEVKVCNDGLEGLEYALQEEIDLIDSFKKLNARGKARVMENVRDLLRIDEYTSKGARSSTFTA